MEDLIHKFKQYENSHPNLANCWMAYLGLKKEHYCEDLATHCTYALTMLEHGSIADLPMNDIVRLFLYKQTLL